MKQLRKWSFLCLLGITGVAGRAQVVSVDISTGKDANGARMAWPQYDDTWRLKKPGSNAFNAIRVGTGFQRDYYGRYYAISSYRVHSIGNSNNCWQNHEYPIAWLTPNPATSDIYDPNYPTTPVQLQGEIKASPSGTYVYKTVFVISPPSCKGVVAAELKIQRLAALDRAKYLVINGQQYDLNDYATGQNSLAAYDFLTYWGLDFASNNEYTCAYYTANSFPPQPYTIPLDPADLQIGTNTIEIYCEVDSDPPYNQKPSGFICDAQVEYTLDYRPVCVDLSGTTALACEGYNADIHIGVSNAGSNTFNVELWKYTSSSATLVPNVAPNPANPISASSASFVYHIVAAAATWYKVRIVDMADPSSFLYETPVPMRLCKVVPMFDLNGTLIHEGKYALQTRPFYDDESSLSGFESKWLLEELDATGKDVLYSIDNPSCWQNQHNGFEAFNSDYADEYRAAGTVTSLTCPADEGQFAEGHIYRITRLVKTDDMDWESYSITITPGVEEFGKRKADPQVTTSVTPAARKQPAPVSIYPNPGKGRFMISAGGGSLVEIFDVAGKKVKQLTLPETTSEHLIDLSSLHKGVYFVNITLAGKSAKQKLLIE